MYNVFLVCLQKASLGRVGAEWTVYIFVKGQAFLCC